jgi:hypothetical protein
VLERFNPDPDFGVRGRVQSPHTHQLKPSKPAGATTREVSFGPFRLLPAQFLLLEGDKPVPLGSRALEILIVLLERPGQLVSKQELMARVWPNLFVEPANLTVHISALRRALCDGRDGKSVHYQYPWARLLLRRLNQGARRRELNAEQPALRRPLCPRLAEISGHLARFTRLAPFVRCNSPPAQT